MCFTMAWLGQMLIWLVILVAVVAILRLLVPYILTQLGGPGGVVAQIINIVLWAVIVIAVIWFAFELLSCFVGSGPAVFPRR